MVVSLHQVDRGSKKTFDLGMRPVPEIGQTATQHITKEAHAKQLLAPQKKKIAVRMWLIGRSYSVKRMFIS